MCCVCCVLQADVYERLDALDSDTTEARAASILHGLGFDKEMQVCRGSTHSLSSHGSSRRVWCVVDGSNCSCRRPAVCCATQCNCRPQERVQRSDVPGDKATAR